DIHRIIEIGVLGVFLERDLFVIGFQIHEGHSAMGLPRGGLYRQGGHGRGGFGSPGSPPMRQGETATGFLERDRFNLRSRDFAHSFTTVKPIPSNCFCKLSGPARWPAPTAMMLVPPAGSCRRLAMICAQALLR